ncbi:MAG: cobalamin biosynthesis protein P47K [Oscillospiraceae bacterium]|nr:cobalamin biosynthesis protein P47K [Oscillospiraceae bacterium]
MKTLILSGFLGSGKTSALMLLAKYIVEHSKYEKPCKVMILENEIGDVGIDDKLLRGGGFQVDNLFSGCACCTVSGELIGAVEKIEKEFDPEWLILETTGVAYPQNIKENLIDLMNIKARVCVLVDAKRWARLIRPMEALLSGQIQKSDCVLVNKVDLVDDEALSKVDSDILGFEPEAKIMHISALSPIAEEVWQTVLGEEA